MRDEMSRHEDVRDMATVELATVIRDACVKAALDAYENARMDGLCHEGAWEVAVGAMRNLNVERIVENRGERGFHGVGGGVVQERRTV